MDTGVRRSAVLTMDTGVRRRVRGPVPPGVRASACVSVAARLRYPPTRPLRPLRYCPSAYKATRCAVLCYCVWCYAVCGPPTRSLRHLQCRGTELQRMALCGTERAYGAGPKPHIQPPSHVSVPVLPFPTPPLRPLRYWRCLCHYSPPTPSPVLTCGIVLRGPRAWTRSPYPSSTRYCAATPLRARLHHVGY
eukprot:1590579-Rhodomonas_salina.2